MVGFNPIPIQDALSTLAGMNCCMVSDGCFAVRCVIPDQRPRDVTSFTENVMSSHQLVTDRSHPYDVYITSR